MSGQRVIFVAGTTAPNLMNLVGDTTLSSTVITVLGVGLMIR